MSDVTPSMRAGGRRVAAVAARRRAAPNAWWGVALLIATEAALFGVFFATYFYLRFRATSWPPAGTPEPELALPLILTAVLVATSAPVWLAARAATTGHLALTRVALLGAAIVQSGYLAVEIHLFVADLDKFTPQSSAYGSIYFALQALHRAHVLFGIMLIVAVLVLLARGLTNYRVVGVQVTAFYTYFVNLMALATIATILTARV